MITQKEIASQLGVSPSLVSRALTGTANEIGVSAETVQRIRDVAAKLNYRPNAAALTLRGAPTRTLGVIVRNFEDPFFGHIIGELQALAWTKQYSLVLTGCPSGKDENIDLASLLKYQLDGVVIVGSDFEPEGLDAFSERGFPLVQIGAGRPRPGTVRVTMDQGLGLQQLVAYLTELGHRDIGYIGDDTPPHLRRAEVAQTILKHHGLAIRPNAFACVVAHDVEAGYEAMQRLLRQCGELLPTAVIAADDVMAQSALRALYEQGIRVPTDLSLAGIDDIPSAKMTIPALTTLRQPIRDMVRRAFQLLTDFPTKSKTQTIGDIVVEPELVIRESCTAPRAPQPGRKRHD
jgi:DNA-binding LacI/PurR family transcriptional regulator